MVVPEFVIEGGWPAQHEPGSEPETRDTAAIRPRCHRILIAALQTLQMNMMPQNKTDLRSSLFRLVVSQAYDRYVAPSIVSSDTL